MLEKYLSDQGDVALNKAENKVPVYLIKVFTYKNLFNDVSI